jgi:hypothetical protein
MDKNLANRLQDIKAHEQAISEQKEFIRASFIAAIKEITNPSIKKIGNFLHTISYKDLENWDVSGSMLRNCLCCYIEENPLCVTLKVIEKLEKCAAKNMNAEFTFWIKLDNKYYNKKYLHYCRCSVQKYFVKGILKNFYSRLGGN